MTEQKTEIQKVIDFLKAVNTSLSIYPYGSVEEISARAKVVAVQEVTKIPVKVGWGNMFSIDASKNTASVGYDYKVAYKFHCISFKSFDEADRLALAIEQSFKYMGWAFNTGVTEKLLQNDIIGIGDVSRSPSDPKLDKKLNRIIVDVDLRMRRAYTVTTDSLQGVTDISISGV